MIFVHEKVKKYTFFYQKVMICVFYVHVLTESDKKVQLKNEEKHIHIKSRIWKTGHGHHPF